MGQTLIASHFFRTSDNKHSNETKFRFDVKMFSNLFVVICARVQSFHLNNTCRSSG